MKKYNLLGRRFTHLTVVAKSEKNNKYKATYWECLCDCGNTVYVRTGHLNAGSYKTCGCKMNFLKHTVKGNVHSVYSAWLNMKDRCTNPNNNSYDRYGGRGIEVCKRWLESYESFYNDMGEKPSSKHSIERVDNNKGYTPSNCIWADDITQVRNRSVSHNNRVGVSGVSWKNENKKWRAAIGIDGKKLHLGYFTNVDDAIKARKEAELKYWS